MTAPSKRSGSRKSVESTTPKHVSHSAQMEALNAREQGKVVMYKQDAWGHVETRFVRVQNVKVWEEKGFFV
jgi:hypothetical protein